MSKKEIHLNLNELRQLIKKTAAPILESYFNSREEGTSTYVPGENADITEEEYEELEQYMQPEYYVNFYTESSGGDGYYTPDETYINASEDDAEKVRMDIQKIPNEHLRQIISNEFESWLNDAQPNMDYSEPDPDRFRDEMYEGFQPKVGDPDYMFTTPFHPEPGDEHFENPEQIQKDKNAAWDELNDKMKPEDPAYSMDSNININGEEMKPYEFYDGTKSKEVYGYPGCGRAYSMNAQSDNTFDKWWGQTGRPTQREFHKACDTWFPADFDDTQFSDSTYRVDNHGKVNESVVKSYLKRLVKEALDGVNNQQFVIQTRTGGYLMEIKDDSVSYDENTLALSALVGRSPVYILVNREDYQNLLNNGQACEASYRILNRGGEASPEAPCSISIYNA